MKIKAISEDDQRLLQGIINANKDQLIIFYNQFLPEVLLFVKKNNGGEEDGKDVFQDAIIVLHKKVKEGLELQVPLRRYFMTICRNLWLMQIRKKKRMTVLDGTEIDDVTPDVLQKMEQTMQDNLYYKHLRQLSENCQEILRQFFDKAAMKAIAEKMNSSESYVKKRKHICKEKLVAAIKADPEYKEIMRS